MSNDHEVSWLAERNGIKNENLFAQFNPIALSNSTNLSQISIDNDNLNVQLSTGARGYCWPQGF